MKRNPFFKLVRARTVQYKFSIIIGLIVIILIFSLTDFWFGVKVMSGIRAYVGGEGLWSKAQKEAVNSLLQYAHSADETNYDHYLSLLKVQAGDKQARLELDKPNPDYQVIRDGFIQGRNNPADVDDMTFLYRQFHKVSYMSAAIKIWTAGDAEMSNLEATGNQLHDFMVQPKGTSAKARQAQLLTLTSKIHVIDNRLTGLEDSFSATLGVGSRSISNALLRLTIFTTGLFGLLAVIIAFVVGRTVVRLDKSKTEFVSLASHQLRTPLTAINWYAEALLGGGKGKLTEGQREYMQELASGGRRMAHLINDILKVSSLDLGTYKLDTKLVNVSDVLKTVVGDIQPDITHKQLRLMLNVQPDLPDAKVDDQLLTATFQNLLTNSVKYTPNGGQITVDVTRRRHTLMIHVGDTGIGIPRSQQSQIFSKLFRADNAKQLDEGGSGLGLYIVHALIERMNGNIWFVSDEGHGTDFYVTLPIYRGIHARHSN